MEIPTLITFGVLLLLVLSVVFSNCFTVEQQTVRMITRFGKYRRTAIAGLNFKWPFIEAKSKPLSLRTEQHVVQVESITKDKVTVTLKISVQSQVIPANASDAYYKLANPVAQIESYVFDAVRSKVPEMNLDDVFQNKGEIANAVEKELREDMAAYGFQIQKALVTEITPDAKVVAAMNDINAASREQIAAQARGEATKILVIKQAEAEAAQKKLRGEGVANEREAIATGIRNSLETLKAAGVPIDEVLRVLMTAQGFDAMRDMAATGKSTIIFAPNSPDGFAKLFTAVAGAEQVQ
ncbi:MAG TPA: SPFH domain-containing protein [Stellaceae bacterium]|nr:SPFH domain-containing protein [Stellaceae bacterium]